MGARAARQAMHDSDTVASSLKKYQTLLLVGAGVFLSTMDSSMVNVALPFIMESFGAPLRTIQWVVLIYLLSITVTLLATVISTAA